MDTSTEVTPDKDKSENQEFDSIHDISYRIFLAGLGAIALTHDEVEEFVDKLVERGEAARKDREEFFKERREHHRKMFEQREKYFHKKMEKFFNHINIPARKDIDELTAKIAELEKKIDELSSK